MEVTVSVLYNLRFQAASDRQEREIEVTYEARYSGINSDGTLLTDKIRVVSEPNGHVIQDTCVT